MCFITPPILILEESSLKTKQKYNFVKSYLSNINKACFHALFFFIISNNLNDKTMQKKFLSFTFMLGFLVLVATETHAQSDAYFDVGSSGNREGSAGLNFDGFSSPQGNGFNFGGFSGNGGNGFDFDDFSGSGGDGFSFDNFNGTPDNVPLGSGLLLLAGLAGLWRMGKDKSKR